MKAKSYTFKFFLLSTIIFLLQLPIIAQPTIATPDGYAGARGTTGGGNAAPITVSTPAAFRAAVNNNNPAVIIVNGRLNVGTVSIGSNKTIVGANTSSGLYGGTIQIRGTNYILQNLTIGPSNDDCIEIRGATNVFITKCDIYDGADGNLDIVRGADHVTVSYCKFYYTVRHNHRFTMLIGNGDNVTSDEGKLHVTLHHNWFADWVDQRMPRVRYGTIHIYNNYYNSTGNLYCIGTGHKSRIRVENTYFENVREPWRDYGGVSSGARMGWSNLRMENSTQPTYIANSFPVFSLPYTFQMDPVDNVKSIVRACAGNVHCNTTTQPATLTKHGSGPSSQTLVTGTPIEGFHFAWQNATTVTVTGLPTGINAAIDNNSRTVTFSGTPTQSGTFQYVVNTVGGSPNTSSGGTFTISSGQAAVLTKHGSGPSSQTIKVGETIQGFHFAWQNANSVTVDGLPNGIRTTIDNTARTIHFSGSPTEAGTFRYTVTTTGGNPNTSTSATFTVNFSEPAILTKHGSGPSSQTIEMGQAIQGFHFAWQNATSVTVTGLPQGIATQIDNVARTITFSGIPQQSGIFTYSLTTVGGAPDISRSATFTINEPLPLDCKGVAGGSANLDACGVCVEGNTGFLPCAATMELETACDVEGILEDSFNPGFSGTGYVNTHNMLGAHVTWYMHSEADQLITFTFRYANGAEATRNGTIHINGAASGELVNPSTGAWSNWQLFTTNLRLKAGLNEIRIVATSEAGLADLDLIHYSTGISRAECVITSMSLDRKTEPYLYPNPTNSHIRLSENANWELTDMMGSTLLTGESDLVDMVPYPEGIYLIRIKGQVHKVIKQ